MGGDDGSGRGTTLIEGIVQCHSDGHDIVGRDAETSCREPDLGDKIVHLILCQVHELVDLILTWLALVGVESGHPLHGAAEQGTEVLVQMGEEEVLRRGIGVGGLVQHERSRAAVVEEVDRGCHAVLVGRLQRSVEVLEEIDGHALLHLTLREDPRNHYPDVGLCVVSDDGGVDYQSEQRHLILGGVVHEQCGRIIIADGGIRRTLTIDIWNNKSCDRSKTDLSEGTHFARF